MFPENVEKGTTIKRKNMPLREPFFILKVAPVGIENYFKGQSIKKPPKLDYANISAFKIAKS